MAGYWQIFGKSNCCNPNSTQAKIDIRIFKPNQTNFIHILNLIGLNSPTQSSYNPNRNPNNPYQNLICPPLLKIEINPRNGHMLKVQVILDFWLLVCLVRLTSLKLGPQHFLWSNLRFCSNYLVTSHVVMANN